MSEEKGFTETSETSDQRNDATGKRTHPDDSEDEDVPLKQAKIETEKMDSEAATESATDTKQVNGDESNSLDTNEQAPETTTTISNDGKEDGDDSEVHNPVTETDSKQPDSDQEKPTSEMGSEEPVTKVMDEPTDSVYDLSVKSMDKTAASKPDSPTPSVPKTEENKENIQSGLDNDNGPIDLSTSKSSPDVIMLSDEDDENAQMMNGHVNGDVLELCADKLRERQKLIKHLQEELRNEEAKLVLLKKIRQSQASVQVTEPEKSSQSAAGANKVHSSAQRSSNAGTVPPPLVRGGQTPAHTKSNSLTPQLLRTQQHQQQQQHHHQLHRGGSGGMQNQGPPPLVMAPRNSSQSHLQHNSRGSHHPVTTTPNHISGFRQIPQQPPQPPPQPEQTPAQRQAAAKLALRKQLEKTLLQIPPPKPPPPEMNFIPSLSSSDFILLVGLEETVKYITDADKTKEKTEVKYVFNPFTCVQCGTDFTPVWKRDKVGSRNVICEQCVTTNQKKALKQEHTNRLKSAFVKALQQEQEIEQRMQSQTNAAAVAAAAAAQAANSSNNSSSSGGRETSSSGGGGGGGSSSSANNAGAPMNLSTNFKPSREQIQQHHNLIQAHQAHQAAQIRQHQLAGLQAFNQRLAFPFPLANYQTGKPSDMHRQYLLDMIPPRSMPGGTVLWKS